MAYQFVGKCCCADFTFINAFFCYIFCHLILVDDQFYTNWGLFILYVFLCTKLSLFDTVLTVLCVRSFHVFKTYINVETNFIIRMSVCVHQVHYGCDYVVFYSGFNIKTVETFRGKMQLWYL